MVKVISYIKLLRWYLIPCFVFISFSSSFCQGLEPQPIQDIIVFKVKPEFRALCNSDNINSEKLNTILDRIKPVYLKKLFPGHQPPAQAKRQWAVKHFVDLSLIYELKLNTPANIQKIIGLLETSQMVTYAQPKPVAYPLFIPNDDSIKMANQYYLDNIEAFAGWDVDSGDTNVIIGIVDSGTDWDHPDLANNIYYNSADPIDGLDNDNDGYTDNYRGWDLADNDNDPSSNAISWHHGTLVSGLAAASTNNGQGIAGSGFKCRYLPVKTQSDNLSYHTAAYEGIVYAADHGCHIINCSWGSISNQGQFELDIINYATFNKDALVIAAAGNSGDESVFFPASLENVISVAGTDMNDVKYEQVSSPSSSSNYGIHIDICAPGFDIYTTTNGGGYGYSNSGTSYSAPLVSGCAAIVRSHFPNLNSLQVGEQLKVTAYNIDTIPGNSNFANKLGGGRVDLFKALTDTSNPSIKMKDKIVADGNDEIFQPGETITIQGTFVNYLWPTSNLNISIASSSPYISIINGSFNPGILNTLDSISNDASPFSIQLDATTPYNEFIELMISYSDGGYSGIEYIGLMVNLDWINMDINEISTTVTSESTFGYTNPAYPVQPSGLGFEFNGDQLLYEGGLMVGAIKSGITGVSDNLRDSLGIDSDFSRILATNTIPSPLFGDKEIEVTINDAGSPNKLDIEVNQMAYAWSSIPDANYVIMTYDIINSDTAFQLQDLYVGLFADWDIWDYSLNKVSFDNANRMGYTFSSQFNTPYAGIKLLSEQEVFHYAIDNINGGGGGLNIYYPDALSTHKKYKALSSNRHNAGSSGGGNDVIDIVSAGPMTLNPGDTAKVAFALLAADNIQDLFEAANQVQGKYDSLFYNPDTTIISIKPIRSKGISLLPNPMNEEVYIKSHLPILSVEIWDVTGKLISKIPGPNKKQLILDKSHLPNPGTYLIMVHTQENTVVEKLLVF